MLLTHLVKLWFIWLLLLSPILFAVIGAIGVLVFALSGLHYCLKLFESDCPRSINRRNGGLLKVQTTNRLLRKGGVWSKVLILNLMAVLPQADWVALIPELPVARLETYLRSENCLVVIQREGKFCLVGLCSTAVVCAPIVVLSTHTPFLNSSSKFGRSYMSI